MFVSYTQIYDARGANYHAAMQRWPQARRNEFATLMEYAHTDANAPRIVDVPSGGGYIDAFLPRDATLIAVDPARIFLESGRHPLAAEVICAPHDKIPIANHTVDLVISLAGLHHLSDQAAAYREWARILRPGGILAIGDASRNSPSARFLDEVVGTYNTMGHSGLYLTESNLRDALDSAGFDIKVAGEREYEWTFSDRRAMLDFCRLLFTMDLNPSDEELTGEIERTVGFRESETVCALGWSLYFVRAVRRSPPFAPPARRSFELV